MENDNQHHTNSSQTVIQARERWRSVRTPRHLIFTARNSHMRTVISVDTIFINRSRWTPECDVRSPSLVKRHTHKVVPPFECRQACADKPDRALMCSWVIGLGGWKWLHFHSGF